MRLLGHQELVDPGGPGQVPEVGHGVLEGDDGLATDFAGHQTARFPFTTEGPKTHPRKPTELLSGVSPEGPRRSRKDFRNGDQVPQPARAGLLDRPPNGVGVVREEEIQALPGRDLPIGKEEQERGAFVLCDGHGGNLSGFGDRGSLPPGGR